MAQYFTLTELTHSATASAKNIINVPPPEAVTNLTRLMEKLLDPIRERYGAPLKVNSGYRSPELNRQLKGAKNSAHLRGEAADITTGMLGATRVLFDLIRTMQADGEIEFDQLINEKGYTWIHISLKASGNRNQILHIP